MEPGQRMDFAEQDAFLRRLARGLLADPDDRDEITQQVWLDVLSKDEADRPRGWFARALRNKSIDLMRRRGVRRRHEREMARMVASRDSGRAAEAMHEVLARLVCELREPYRSTIHMRFYEGLPPREIARRTGKPIDTVRTHLQRGLQSLREEFDRRGGRKRWTGALLVLAGERGGAERAGAAPSVPAGGFSMLSWVAFASLAAGVSFFGLLPLMRSPSRKVDVAREILSVPAKVEVTVGGSASERRAVDVPTPASPAERSVKLVKVVGRVLWDKGEPAAGVDVVAIDHKGQADHEWTRGRVVARTDAAGGFDAPGVPWPGVLTARSGRFVSRETALLHAPESDSVGGIELHLVPSRTIHGTVSDSNGRPVEHARIRSGDGIRVHEVRPAESPRRVLLLMDLRSGLLGSRRVLRDPGSRTEHVPSGGRPSGLPARGRGSPPWSGLHRYLLSGREHSAGSSR